MLFADRILVEGAAHDTLSSVENCAAIIARTHPASPVVVASDRYHLARCVLLFRLYGVEARGLRIESGLTANGPLRWLYYYLRECAALPWDAALAVIKRLGRNSRQATT